MATHTFGRDAETVFISVAEYESLLETGRRYYALRQALLAGGVTNESLDVLVSSGSLPTPTLTPDDSPIDGPTSNYCAKSGWAPAATAHPFVPNAHASTCSDRQQNLPRLQTTLNPCNPSPPETAHADEEEIREELMADAQQDEQAGGDNISTRRSLVISGLSRATTLQSVSKALRGGMILEMYLRLQKCSAHVSFVDPVAAEKFLEYAQMNDVYILGKKVAVDWDDQQRWIKPKMTNRIAHAGLTRNLVVRFAKEDWTANTIREDLHHIHLLEVVDLFFRNGHVYISLNGIQHALTARTCMHSQFRYRRMKIDCWPDDCAQPLAMLPIKQPQYPMPSQRAMIRGNRFELLEQDTGDSKESADLMQFSEY